MTLSANERTLFARFQEAFAAFLDHTDAQIGRLLDTLERLGELDNTLVILTSDNGASQEGGPNGQVHEMAFFNMRFDSADEMIHRLDDIGGPNAHNNYPWGWSQAGNCPNKWYKQNTHAGGVRSPLIMHWPQRITDTGGLRHQFHHVVDIAPTVYEAIGITPPDVYNGYEQIPVAGTPILYTLDDAGGALDPNRPVLRDDGPSRHRRGRLEGRDPARLHPPRHRGHLGAVLPPRRLLRVQRPRRRTPGEARAPHRSLVVRDGSARRLAIRHPGASNSSPHPASRTLRTRAIAIATCRRCPRCPHRPARQ